MAKIVSNNANIDYSYIQGDLTKAGNAITGVADSLITGAPLTVQNIVTPGYLEPNEDVSYTIIISNNSLDSITNIVITDVLNSKLKFLADAKISINGGASTSIASTGVLPTLIFTIPTLTSSSVATITFTAENLTLLPGDVITNQASVLYTGETVPVLSNQATFNYSFAKLTAKKTAPVSVVCGKDFEYEILLTNTGDISATGVSITDDLPHEFVIKGWTPTAVEDDYNESITINGVAADVANFVYDRVETQGSEKNELTISNITVTKDVPISVKIKGSVACDL